MERYRANRQTRSSMIFYVLGKNIGLSPASRIALVLLIDFTFILVGLPMNIKYIFNYMLFIYVFWSLVVDQWHTTIQERAGLNLGYPWIWLMFRSKKDLTKFHRKPCDFANDTCIIPLQVSPISSHPYTSTNVACKLRKTVHTSNS
jgi:hypothetical protein